MAATVGLDVAVSVIGKPSPKEGDLVGASVGAIDNKFAFPPRPVLVGLEDGLAVLTVPPLGLVVHAAADNELVAVSESRPEGANVGTRDAILCSRIPAVGVIAGATVLPTVGGISAGLKVLIPVGGKVVGVEVEYCSLLPPPVLLDGAEEGADENEPPQIPSVGLLLGGIVWRILGTPVGLGVSSLPVACVGDGANVGAGETITPRSPSVELIVGKTVAGPATGMAVGLSVFSLPIRPPMDGLDVGANENAPLGTRSV